MDAVQNLYLDLAQALFVKGQLEEAITYSQKAFEAAPCKEVFDLIYERFVLPNEAQFRENYQTQCKDAPLADYAACTIAFLPAGEERYVLLDRESFQFRGEFSTDGGRGPAEGEPSLSSLLIADEWDIRKMLPVLWERKWENIYIVLNEAKYRFMSFFKLPGIWELLPERMHIFSCTEELKSYFLNDPGTYLPKRVFAPNEAPYRDVLADIHSARIQGGAPSDRVFLSICIPTYNRGSRALQTVKKILETEYDAEIEIAVANNGSFIECEEYRRIGELRDSRLHYRVFEKNGGYLCSMCNALQIARGHFALLLSDEDTLRLDNLGAFLDYLNNADNLGGCLGHADNVEADMHASERFTDRASAVYRAVTFKWLSGCCFNLDMVRSGGLIARLKQSLKNEYVCLYPQSALFAILAENSHMAFSGIAMWRLGKPHKTGGSVGTRAGDVFHYSGWESRSLQERDMLRWLAAEPLTDQEYRQVFLQVIRMIFATMSTACLQGSATIPSWFDLWVLHYQNCMKILREVLHRVGPLNAFLPEMDEVFLYWLECRKVRPCFSEEENQKMSIRYQVIAYCHRQGIPLKDLDFSAINECIDGFTKTVDRVKLRREDLNKPDEEKRQ